MPIGDDVTWMARHLEPGPGYRRGSVLVGSLLMVGVSLLLFFVPLVNGLVGGLVGGYKVGGVGRALGAAVLPSAVLAGGLWLLLAVLDLPLVGFIAGLAFGLIILLSDLGLFLGAALGGALARRPRERRIFS